MRIYVIYLRMQYHLQVVSIHLHLQLPLPNSIYDLTKEEQKRQKEDYINSLSEMIAPSNEPNNINKVVSIEAITSN